MRSSHKIYFHKIYFTAQCCDLSEKRNFSLRGVEGEFDHSDTARLRLAMR